MSVTLSETEFKKELMAMERYYHIYHPYHIAMNAGKLNSEQISMWVANRFYYQITIPRKDAFILANCPDREVRRHWMQRIIDHDGCEGEEGGIEAWLRLGEACGLTREEIINEKHVLSGVRFSVDAYINFVRNASWQEGICASLTELFAPAIHKERLANWPTHYPWIHLEGLTYFRTRLEQAPRDVEYALQIVLKHFRTREQQQRALSILKFKLNILWTLLDALELNTVFRNVGYLSRTLPGCVNMTKGYRLQWEEVQQTYVLLYPEGIIKLNKSAAEILKYCDGKHSINDIIEGLKSQFSGVDLSKDVIDFMEIACEKQWVYIQ